jgi:hypothetical protein
LTFVQADIVKALRAVHSRFFLSVTILNIALVGPGLVGATLLKQVQDQKEKLQKKYNMDIRVLAIADSKKMLLSDTGTIHLGQGQAWRVAMLTAMPSPMLYWTPRWLEVANTEC